MSDALGQPTDAARQPTDAALDREIESMLAVDPSADFLARVRARVVEEPAPVGWRIRWALGFAAAAVVTVAVVVLLRPDNGADPAPSRVTPTLVIERTAPEVVASVEPRESQAVPAPYRTTRPRRAPRAATAASAERLIPLVNEEDAKAFDALLATIRSRAVVVTFNESQGSVLAASDLAIAPIDINPLADTLEGGVE
jgi:hypothetical protein